MKISALKAALIGFLLVLPVGILWSSLYLGLEAPQQFFELLFNGGGDRPTVFSRIVMLAILFALPAGLIIALMPMVRKDAVGKRHMYALNILVVILALVLMIPTWGTLAREVYECDILHAPNCD